MTLPAGIDWEASQEAHSGRVPRLDQQDDWVLTLRHVAQESPFRVRFSKLQGEFPLEWFHADLACSQRGQFYFEHIRRGDSLFVKADCYGELGITDEGVLCQSDSDGGDEYYPFRTSDVCLPYLCGRLFFRQVPVAEHNGLFHLSFMKGIVPGEENSFVSIVHTPVPAVWRHED